MPGCNAIITITDLTVQILVHMLPPDSTDCDLQWILGAIRLWVSVDSSVGFIIYRNHISPKPRSQTIRPAGSLRLQFVMELLVLIAYGHHEVKFLPSYHFLEQNCRIMPEMVQFVEQILGKLGEVITF